MTYRVFVNPGHCPGVEPGCCNRELGLTEAEYVKEIGQLLTAELQKYGYNARCMQTNNLRNAYDDDWDDPCIITEANDWCPDIAVSIHCNAFNGIANGTECICFERGSDGERLARLIQNKIVPAIGTANRGVKYEEDKEKGKRLSFIMLTDMPAVVVECAFLDNYEDAMTLIENKDVIAKAICQGIIEYFEV